MIKTARSGSRRSIQNSVLILQLLLTANSNLTSDRLPDSNTGMTDSLLSSSSSTSPSLAHSSSGGLMIERGCNGFGLLFYLLFLQYCSASFSVLRVVGRSGRHIIPKGEYRCRCSWDQVKLNVHSQYLVDIMSVGWVNLPLSLQQIVIFFLSANWLQSSCQHLTRS